MLILTISFIAVCIALTGIILLQNKSAGLGAAFGGSDTGFHVRRGSEKYLFRTTIVLSALFIILGLAHLLVT